MHLPAYKSINCLRQCHILSGTITYCYFLLRWHEGQATWVGGDFEDLCQTRFSQESAKPGPEPENSVSSSTEAPKGKGTEEGSSNIILIWICNICQTMS